MKRFKIGEKVKIGNTTGIIVGKKQEPNGLWYKIQYTDYEDKYTYEKNKNIEKIVETK